MYYGYKRVCVDDKFSIPFKKYLGDDDVYIFVCDVIDEASPMLMVCYNKISMIYN